MSDKLFVPIGSISDENELPLACPGRMLYSLTWTSEGRMPRFATATTSTAEKRFSQFTSLRALRATRIEWKFKIYLDIQFNRLLHWSHGVGELLPDPTFLIYKDERV